MIDFLRRVIAGAFTGSDKLDINDRTLQESSANEYGVLADVHLLDFIYRFCVENPCFSSRDLAVKYYFRTGSESAQKFSGIVREFYPNRTKPLDVLEFAAGYGCVTRHLLRSRDSLINLTSCDIHPDALAFLRERVGVPAIPSEHVPEAFVPEQRFDVVFALSFFSHMPRTTFGRWLRALFQTLRSPGYLVFTTQGLEGARHIGCQEIPADGYWFAPASEQKDLETEEYGSTLALPQFVIGEIFAQLHAPIAMYRYAYWWGTQDLWVVKRTDMSLPSVSASSAPEAG